MHKKVSLTVILLGIILILTSCSWTENIFLLNKMGDKVADEKFEHDAANIDSIYILNGAGNIDITATDMPNIKIDLKKVASKGTEEEKKIKLEAMKLNMSVKDKKLLISMDCKNNDKMSYWSWLAQNYDSKGAKIHYTLQVPKNITLYKVCNILGDVNIKDIKSAVQAEVINGNITVNGIDIKDFAMLNTYRGNVKLDIKDMSSAKVINTEIGLGNLEIRVPQEANYEVQKDSLRGLSQAAQALNGEAALQYIEDIWKRWNSETIAIDTKAKSGKTAICTIVLSGDTDIHK